MASIDIGQLRKLLGDISQSELGRRLGGVSQSTISRWETGLDEPEGPAAVVLKQLNEAAGGEETPRPKPTHTLRMTAEP